MKTTSSDSLKAKKMILKGKRAVATYLPERWNRLLQGDCKGDALEVVDEEQLKNLMKHWSLAVSLGLRGKWVLI